MLCARKINSGNGSSNSARTLRPRPVVADEAGSHIPQGTFGRGGTVIHGGTMATAPRNCKRGLAGAGRKTRQLLNFSSNRAPSNS